MREDRIFWGVGDKELLTATDPEEAIEEHLDYWGDISAWSAGSTVTAEEYAPRKINIERETANLLEILYESLSEEYEHPEVLGDNEGPSVTVWEAARKLMELVAEKYTVTLLKPTGRKYTVDVRKWVEENRPDWLEEE